MNNKKIAIVLGGSSGIGLQIVNMLAKKDYFVYFSYFHSKVISIKNTKAIYADLTNEKDVINFFNIAFSTNKPTILICAQAISLNALLIDNTIDDYNNIFNNNVLSVFLSNREFIKRSQSIDDIKYIINISSIWGKYGASCEALYSASKGAINSFTQAIAKEYALSNYRCNVIAPGATKTKMLSSFNKDELKNIAESNAIGKIASTEDIAKVVISVFDNNLDFLNGEIIEVSGCLI